MEAVCAELERGADATRLVPLTKAVLERRDRTPTVEYERLVLSCARGIVRALSDAAGREAGSATEATSGMVADAELAVEQVAALGSLFENAAQSPRRGDGQPDGSEGGGGGGSGGGSGGGGSGGSDTNGGGGGSGGSALLHSLGCGVVEAGGDVALLSAITAFTPHCPRMLPAALALLARLKPLAPLPATTATTALTAAAAALKQLPAASPALRDPAAFDAIDASLETELPKLLPRRERGDEPGGDAAFRASLAARLELISAAVGRSPVLTIRLRAVRRLADGAVSRAKGLASAPASEGDLLADLAAAICRAGVLAALLGPLAHEEVLRRAAPLFALLREQDASAAQLEPLWASCAFKPAAVAQQAAVLLRDAVGSGPRCNALRGGLLETMADCCAAHGDCSVVGAAPSLATIAPAFASSPAPLAHRFTLLLVRLLASESLPAATAAATTATLRATLVGHLRASPLTARMASVSAACRPLQRLCGIAVAAPPDERARAARPPALHHRSSSDPLCKSDPHAAATLAADAADGWWPASLAAAADRLSPRGAMELLRELGSSGGSGASPPPLLAQAESKFGLVAIALALLAAPRTRAPPRPRAPQAAAATASAGAAAEEESSGGSADAAVIPSSGEPPRLASSPPPGRAAGAAAAQSAGRRRFGISLSASSSASSSSAAAAGRSGCGAEASASAGAPGEGGGDAGGDAGGGGEASGEAICEATLEELRRRLSFYGGLGGDKRPPRESR